MTPVWTVKLVALFALIQLVSLILTVCGIPICAALAFFELHTYDLPSDTLHWRGGRLTWLWDNDEDGIAPYWYNPQQTRWKIFVWTALRNSCSNLRYVRGISDPGRPLWYQTWTIRGRQFYAKAGWGARTGWPMMSAGSGRGY